MVASITSWNYPLGVMTREVGRAMATRCTVIVNSAKQSPISALAFRKLVEMAGVPAGVDSIVTGNAGPISDELFENPVVRKISFTGSTEVGPLVSRDGLAKVEEHVQDALAKGVRLLCGGQRVEGELADGMFYAPTVLGGVNKDMLNTYKETFGPVAPIIPFETEEVIELANNTEYESADYFYTQNISRELGFRSFLRVGN
ncbi:MAG: aldehyde dehydrogenase family protein [Bacillota bacterium]